MINAALAVLLLSGTEPFPLETAFDACLTVATDRDPAELGALEFKPAPNETGYPMLAYPTSDLGGLVMRYDNEEDQSQCTIYGADLWREDVTYDVTWTMAKERALAWLDALSARPGWRLTRPESVYDDPAAEYCAPDQPPLRVVVGSAHDEDETGDFHVPFRPDGAIFMTAYRDRSGNTCE